MGQSVPDAVEQTRAGPFGVDQRELLVPPRGKNKMQAPLVSVVLPTFNRAGTLPRAIRSVLGQTLENLELIVVDDGSTDETQSYLRTVEDPRLRVVMQPANAGAAAARNAGIAATRADWIAFQDSDDEWLAEKLERQMAALRQAPPGYEACYCGRIIYGLGPRARWGRGQVTYTPSVQSVDDKLEGDILPALRRGNLMANTQLVVARSVLDRAGGYDETLGNNQDWDIVLRLAKATKFCFVEEPLVIAFSSGDSISRDHLLGARTKLRILEKYADDFRADPAALARHYFYAGLVENRFGDIKAAVRLFSKSVSLNKSDARAWTGLAASRIGMRFPHRKNRSQ